MATMRRDERQQNEREATRRIEQALRAGWVTALVAGLAACGPDGGSSSAPSLSKNEGAFRTAQPSTFENINRVWDLVGRPDLTDPGKRGFLESAAFVRKCDDGVNRCRSGTDLNGDGTPANLGCWANNDCQTNGTNPPLYRRPTTKAGTPPLSTYHEGQLLADAVAYIATMIRRNAFGADSKLGPESDSLYLAEPNFKGPGWDLPGAVPAYTWAGMVENLALINYEVRRFYDENMDRVLLVIGPKNWRNEFAAPDTDGRNWGLFIFNTHPTSSVVVEVPHPKFDLNSERLGAEAFEKGDAFALFIAGAHRRAVNLEDTSTDDYYHVNGKADPCHEQEKVRAACTPTAPATTCAGTVLGDVQDFKSGFEWAHEGVTTWPAADGTSMKKALPVVTLQMHGFDENSGSNTVYRDASPRIHAVLSTGDTKSTDAFRDAVIGGVNAARYTNGSSTPTFRLAGPIGTTLAATTNVQGKHNRASGVAFLHLEADSTIRHADSSGDRVRNDDEKPNLGHLIARHVAWAADQWMFSVPIRALMPLSVRTFSPWKCSGPPLFGIDNDVYPDPDPDFTKADWPSGPYTNCPTCSQKEVQAYPNDRTMLAQIHRGNVKFVFYHLESPHYVKPTLTGTDCTSAGFSWSGTDCTDPYGRNYRPQDGPFWSGHREALEQAGARVLPVYFAPIPTCGTCDMPGLSSTPAIDPRAKGSSEAQDAWNKAKDQGFASGTTIYLDVEDSNHHSGGTIHANTRAYVRAWMDWFNRSQPGGGPSYKMGVYCSTYNCDWIARFLQDGMCDGEAAPCARTSIPPSAVKYWVHDWGCASTSVPRCGDKDCGSGSMFSTTFSPGTTNSTAGCQKPHPAPSYSSFASLAANFDPDKALPYHANGLVVPHIWQYAGHPIDPASKDSTHPGCIGTGGTHGYVQSTLYAGDGVATDAGVTTGWGCQLRPVGDFSKFSAVADLNAAQECWGGNGVMTKPLETVMPAKFAFDDITLSAPAQTLHDCVTSPNCNVAATAATLDVDPGLVYTWRDLYAKGGTRVIDNRLVLSSQYVAEPTPGSTIVNGTFETQDFTGWTTSGASWIRPYQPAWGGGSTAVVGQTTSAALDSVVSQTFTVPTGAMKSLSFYYRVACLDYGVQYDQFWVVLRDNTLSTSTTLVSQVCSNTGAWQQVDHSLAGLEGHSLTLEFHTHDDGVGAYPTYADFDHVVMSTVDNGSFERGLAGWTSSGITAQNQTGQNDGYGLLAARVGSIDPYTDSALWQTFTIPTTGVLDLSFDYKVVCLDSVSYAWATVTLHDNDTGLTHELVAKTCTNNGFWDVHTFPVGELAGHSVTLRFDVHDDNYPGDPIHMLVENVRLH